MTRTRYHQAGYVFKKGSVWYLRYRENVPMEDGSIARIQKCRRLAKATGQYQRKRAAKSWPMSLFGSSTMVRIDLKAR